MQDVCFVKPPECFVKAEAAEPMAKARDCSCWGKTWGNVNPKLSNNPNTSTLGSHFLYTALHLGANSTDASLSVYIPIIPEPFGHFGEGFPYNHRRLGNFPQRASR